MNLGSLDLNLIVALDALLREVSVTRAAERLNLTQPTLSSSLGRLRKHFGDELIHRNGNQFELTPLALRLQPLVDEAVGTVDRLFKAHREFDPTESRRRYSVVTSDYGLALVGGRWSELVSRQAPRARLAFRSIGFESLSPVEIRSRDVDGILAPQGFVPTEMPHLDLVTDRWVIVADRDNMQIGAAPTMHDLRDVPWAAAFDGPQQIPAGVQRHDWASLAARVEVVVDTFASIPICVRGTSRVALMQERLVDASGARSSLRVLAPPFPVDPIVLSFSWHPSYTLDFEHAWFRSRLDTPPSAG